VILFEVKYSFSFLVECNKKKHPNLLVTVLSLHLFQDKKENKTKQKDCYNEHI